MIPGAVSPACDSDTSMYVSKLGSGDYIQTSDQVDSALGKYRARPENVYIS